MTICRGPSTKQQIVKRFLTKIWPKESFRWICYFASEVALITLLKKNYPIVVLSRGYKRKTKGVVVSSSKSTAATIGDEPYQFLKKHSDISVVVAEKRVLGIQKIKEFSVPNSVILLDDIMQHRYVKPSLLILTTTYEAPFFLDRILPVGSLRESKKGAKRAAVILVTKCK